MWSLKTFRRLHTLPLGAEPPAMTAIALNHNGKIEFHVVPQVRRGPVLRGKIRERVRETRETLNPKPSSLNPPLNTKSSYIEN